MKKCLNCGTECQDEDLFCPKCGAKLVNENACPKCGNPIDPKDAFCRHCGHKIEKEYKCEQCGAVLSPDAKFCPQCGAKVENPTVALKQRKTAEKKALPTNLMNKITFLVFGGVMILLFSLILIGCFGDILAEFEVPRNTGLFISSSSEDSKVSISYFFGKAFQNIKNTSDTMKYPEYKAFMIFALLLEYNFWFVAIAFAIVGLCHSIITLCKGYKNNDYTVKNGLYIGSLFAILPYLFMFSIKLKMSLTVSSAFLVSEIGSKDYTYGITFGWGTMMIFVCEIIAVCFIVLQKVAEAISEKKNIVRTSILSAISITFFILFITSIGKAVGFNASESGATISGHASVLNVYTSSLAQYSADAIKEIPSEAIKCLTGSIFLLIAYVFGLVESGLIIRKPNKIVSIIIFGAFLFVLIIVGSVLSYQGASRSFGQYATAVGLSAKTKAITYSYVGVVLPIFIVLSIVGIIITQKVKANNKAQA